MMYIMSKARPDVIRFSLEAPRPHPTKGNIAIDFTGIDQLAAEVGMGVVNRGLLLFPKGAWGGNHAHEREELMIATAGNPTMWWRSQDTGKVTEVAMGPDEEGRLSAFYVPQWVGHLVVNQGDETASLVEFSTATTPSFLDLSELPTHSLLSYAGMQNDGTPQ